MSETKFTPGPWKHTEALPRLVEASVPLRRNGWKVPTTVCHLGEGNGWCKERKWNAFLIAAAPELYKELEKHCALCMMMHPDCDGCEICDTGKVLKKARGEE